MIQYVQHYTFKKSTATSSNRNDVDIPEVPNSNPDSSMTPFYSSRILIEEVE